MPDQLGDLVSNRVYTEDAAAFLRSVWVRGASILVSGLADSGKSLLASGLASLPEADVTLGIGITDELPAALAGLPDDRLFRWFHFGHSRAQQAALLRDLNAMRDWLGYGRPTSMTSRTRSVSTRSCSWRWLAASVRSSVWVRAALMSRSPT
jgi:hypothetical protein